MERIFRSSLCFCMLDCQQRLDKDFIEDFNKALRSGVENIDAVVEKFGKTGTITGNVLKKYLTENIDYDFNDEKKKGLESVS